MTEVRFLSPAPTTKGGYITKEIELIIAKQKAGNKLNLNEIYTLMLYALELLRDFR